jgi:hypothetical protein
VPFKASRALCASLNVSYSTREYPCIENIIKFNLKTLDNYQHNKMCIMVFDHLSQRLSGSKHNYKLISLFKCLVVLALLH